MTSPLQPISVPVSKSDYIRYRGCSKDAWIHIHRPDIYHKFPPSDFEQSLMETGNEVELICRKLFPTGMLIEGRDEFAQQQTKDLITKKVSTLFQPIFVADGFLAAADILLYDKDMEAYTLCEIKSSSRAKEEYLYDLAFQVNVLTRAGLSIEKMKLIHINSEYVRDGELNVTTLFAIDDVTTEVQELLKTVAEEMNTAYEHLSKGTEPSGPCDCIYKGRSRHCTTFSYSNPQVPSYSVHDIARIGSSKKKLTELIDSKIFELENIPQHIQLSEIQQNQVDAHTFDRVTVKKAEIADAFNGLVYPLYFLDYETCPIAVPRFDGFSPYQQIPFQYSLHVVQSADAEPTHKEFLYIGKDDPTPAFAASLQEHLGSSGSVIVWHKSFECSINRDIGKRLPQYVATMAAIEARVFDLETLFTAQCYVHKDFHGGTSIKDILPILVPDLSYKALQIRDGGTASNVWNKLTTGTMDDTEKKTVITDLKEYCKLDTFAMYKIWQHLCETAKPS